MLSVIMYSAMMGMTLLAAGHPLQSLSQVKKIYVDQIGQNDEAVRFKMLLEENLVRKGFTLVLQKAEADAILSGILSMRVVDGNSRAFATMALKTRAGFVLWTHEFKEAPFRFSSNDSVKNRAQDVARKLDEDVKKATGRVK